MLKTTQRPIPKPTTQQIPKSTQRTIPKSTQQIQVPTKNYQRDDLPKYVVIPNTSSSAKPIKSLNSINDIETDDNLSLKFKNELNKIIFKDIKKCDWIIKLIVCEAEKLLLDSYFIRNIVLDIPYINEKKIILDGIDKILDHYDQIFYNEIKHKNITIFMDFISTKLETLNISRCDNINLVRYIKNNIMMGDFNLKYVNNIGIYFKNPFKLADTINLLTIINKEIVKSFTIACVN
jgi:hypothetical protein